MSVGTGRTRPLPGPAGGHAHSWQGRPLRLGSTSRSRLEAMPTPSTAAEHIHDLGAYVTASPSSFHAVHEAARRLDAAGFTGLDELQPWRAPAAPALGKFYVIR